ncbi:hypothetical protein Gotri_007721 [Gossypium trilobum]|uniref:Uncharacterized protein n=1 Tax=Gossypium trilobum TaxID=34281 RepID=A0A7J9EIK6_9ROSI|nr:hypothetical protein [Gossypium trilobum]
MRAVGLCKTSEQWRQEIKEENIRVINGKRNSKMLEVEKML